MERVRRVVRRRGVLRTVASGNTSTRGEIGLTRIRNDKEKAERNSDFFTRAACRKMATMRMWMDWDESAVGLMIVYGLNMNMMPAK